MTWQAEEWAGDDACGISEHNEEFIMWGYEADRNYRKYLNQIKSFYLPGGRTDD